MATKKKSTSTTKSENEGTATAAPFATEESVEKPADAPENAVASPLGITLPTKTFKGDGVTPSETGQTEPAVKESSGDELLTGTYVLKGKTFHGQEVTDTVILPEVGVTKQGVFHTFLAHYPDGIQDGFSFEKQEPPETA